MDEDIDNEKTEDEISEETSVDNPLGSMQTLPQLPDIETDSEKLNRIEAVLDKLNAKLGDEDDLVASYETMIQFFKSLKDSNEKLSRNLEKEVDYTRNLQDRLSKNEKEHENLILKKRLDEDIGRLIVIYEDMQKESKANQDTLSQEIKRLDKFYQDKIADLSEKINMQTKIEEGLEQKINEFREQMIKASDNEYTKLAADCKNVLTACNTRMSEMQNDVLTFLKSCQSQTKELISKVPEQKRKFSWKDIIIYALSGVCLISMIIQIFIR